LPPALTDLRSVKYTQSGSITIEARSFDEPQGLRGDDGIAVEIVVADTGCGISSIKLESIFREFEQVEFMGHVQETSDGVGERAFTLAS
jgi:K+-sensing histidine kinase KdpD